MSKYQHGHGFEANWQRSGDTLPFTLCQLILLKTFTVSKSKVNSKLDKEGLFFKHLHGDFINIVSHLETSISLFTMQ